jgi:hypothetical protein
MKKRRVNPSYDSRRNNVICLQHRIYSHSTLGMAERLNNLYSHDSQNHNFNPRSVSFDIRTPEELAAVNDFLLTLGRDVSGAGGRQSQPQSTHNGPSGLSPDTYFDAASLTHLGLTGMPGIPSSSPSYAPDNTYSGHGTQYTNNNTYSMPRSNHASVHTNQYSGVYANVNENYNNSEYYNSSHNNHRHSGKYPPTSNNSSYSNHHHHHPTPPLEISSPHSTVSTPVNTTPPQLPLTMPDTIAAFDYLSNSRGAPAVPHLARHEYMPKSMRTIVPLKSVPGTQSGRPEPVEPRLTPPVYQGPPAKLTPSSVTSSSSKTSLYPLLTAGDLQYKLPPMQRPYRSSSPSSREATPSSSESSPVSKTTVLPSLRSITNSVRTSESEDLTGDIARIELENRTKEIGREERKRHAEFIRDLLVSINSEFRNHADVGPSALAGETSRDVEMAAA